MKNLFIIVVSLFMLSSCGSEVSLNDYTIVISATASESEAKAAAVVQDYINQICGKRLPIVSDGDAATAKEIVVGKTTRFDVGDISSLGEDGYRIKSRSGKIAIYGGEGKGTLYGAYGFVEDYLGCRMYSPTAITVPKSSEVMVAADIDDTQIPVFTYRDPHYGVTNDSTYIDWHRLSHNEQGEKSEWGMWVHTFRTLIAPEEYYDSDTTLFALRSGHRDRRQPCLSNPKVFEIVCENLEKRMAENPNAKYWSISQNDNYEYCTCPECSKVDEENGSPAGMVITFANKVAARYPDKVISTLAYQHTRKAPSKVRPADNVNIMFCSIECNRSKSITDDPTSAEFRKDMEDWAKISKNILVWDYVVNFHSLILPFPNIFILQPNLQFFRDNSVVAMFEQGNGGTGGEFCELKSYLLSKLLWNPDINVDDVITEFCNGYYGAAGEHVKRYVYMLQEELVKSGDPLTIFDRPWIISSDRLYSDENLDRYFECFDKAEKAVAGSAEELKRVRFARQQVNFVAVRTHLLDPFGKYGAFEDNNGKWSIKQEFLNRVNDIADVTADYGMDRLHESWNRPEEYRKLNIEATITENDADNFAFGKKVTSNREYHKVFGGGKGCELLTDGLHGSDEFYRFWQAYEACEEIEFVVDLEKEQSVSEVNSRYLQIKKEWIFFPKSTTVYLSGDGVNYKKVGTLAQEALSDPEVLSASRD